MSREAEIHSFLSQTPWANAPRKPLQGDASFRRYHRLDSTQDQPKVILMDAPPATNGSIQPFLDVAAYLRDQGVNPPEVYRADASHGLALLEDLGDDLFAAILRKQPEQEETLYHAAIDVLTHLHKTSCPDILPTYGASAMAEASALIAQWYAPDDALKMDIEAMIIETFHALDLKADRLAQRDYHAENLIWLPKRNALHKVGLLDFQDAMAAPSAYDLVSLLSDARRDVSQAVVESAKARYIDHASKDPDAFAAEYAFCGAQRNLRILGVFARLYIRDGKDGYLPLMPRVWHQLQEHLSHPSLKPLAKVCTPLPAPSRETLQAIKARKPL